MERSDKRSLTLAYLGVILLVIFLCSDVQAQTEQNYKQDSIIDLKIPCFNNGSYCSGSAICNLTVQYPNGSIFIDNQQLTNSLSYHNYTISDTETIGKYYVSMICDDSGTLGYSTFIFNITPDGTENTDSKSNLLLGVLAILVLFFLISLIAGFSSNNSLAKLGFFGASYVLLLITISIGNLYAEKYIQSSVISDMLLLLQNIFWILGISLLLYIIATFIYSIVFYTQQLKLESLGEEYPEGIHFELKWDLGLMK